MSKERRPAEPTQTSSRAERKALAEFLSRGVNTTVNGRRMQPTRRTRRRIDWQKIEDAGRPAKERRKPQRTTESKPPDRAALTAVTSRRVRTMQIMAEVKNSRRR